MDVREQIALTMKSGFIIDVMGRIVHSENQQFLKSVINVGELQMHWKSDLSIARRESVQLHMKLKEHLRYSQSTARGGRS